jgi:hypothetical protein
VERTEAYASTFGDEFLRDVRKLRAGQQWSDEILALIENADVFQLFWSPSAAASSYVQSEWQHALLERNARPDPYFLRPVYWTAQVVPDPPQELKEIHFVRISI